jgi:hypothetical protein
MGLDMMPTKQHQKQLARLRCATNVWCGDLKGYDFETPAGILALRPDDELFRLCQSLFVRSLTLDYLDVFFRTKPRSRRFQLLASVLWQTQSPKFMDVCLQNCAIIESSFYAHAPRHRIHSVDPLPNNPELTEPANVGMILPSFFVMCSAPFHRKLHWS